MANVNRCIFIGRITGDLELKELPNCKLLNMSIAINEKYGDKENTTYIDFTAFDKKAELIHDWCYKGREVYIECHAQNRKREIDGKNYTFTSFVIDKIDFIGDKKSA